MKIMLCTDGLPHSQAALRFGAMIARNSPASVTLLGVLKKPLDSTVLKCALEEGRLMLKDAPSPLVQVRCGCIAKVILDEAEREGIDLLIFGTQKRDGIRRFLLNYAHERIARCASMSVLVAQNVHSEIKRILLCTAGTKASFRIVEIGGKVAQLTGAQVTVLHVMSQIAATQIIEPSMLEDLDASAETLMAHRTPEGMHLQNAVETLANLGVQAQASVRHGFVVDEILAEAKRGDYDLVVVGVNVADGFMRYVLDDVTHHILAHITRPLLIAK